MFDIFRHLVVEFSEPVAMMLSGIFAFLVLQDRRFKRPYGKRLTSVHIVEHIAVAKGFVVSGVLNGYVVVVHLANEITEGGELPFGLGLDGVILGIAKWAFILSAVATTAHLWAEEQPKFDKRYFR